MQTELTATAVRRRIRLFLFFSVRGENPIEFPLFSSLRSTLHASLSQIGASPIGLARGELSAGHGAPEAIFLLSVKTR
jgi:hypothetical protein